jgi:hypothetical protein
MTSFMVSCLAFRLHERHDAIRDQARLVVDKQRPTSSVMTALLRSAPIKILSLAHSKWCRSTRLQCSLEAFTAAFQTMRVIKGRQASKRMQRDLPGLQGSATLLQRNLAFHVLGPIDPRLEINLH